MGKLRLRLSLKMALTLTIFFIISFSVVTPLILTTITRQQKQSLINQSKSYTILATEPIGSAFLQYRDSGTTLLNERINGVRQLYTAVTRVSVIDVSGNFHFSTDGKQQPIDLKEAATFEPVFRYDDEGFLKQVVYPFIQGNGSHRYTLVYQISSADIRANLATLQNNIIGMAVLVLAITNTVLILLIELLLVRPLRAMSQQAAAISVGEYDRIITLKRNDEIGDLGDALTSMAAKLKSDIEVLKKAEELKSEFLIISSHNLRTPLTVITGYVDLLKDMNLDEKSQGYIAHMEAKAQELTELTNNMLTVAELEGGSRPQLQMQEVDIASLLRDMQEDIQQKTASKSLMLTLSVPEGQYSIKTQITYLQTALWNLVDNAIKFTPEKGSITVELEDTTDAVEIIVRDTGPGISENELPQLFTKFHRGTSIMKYQYEGVGLGLYMTKLMIDLLGGSIQAESIEGKGSTFTITLPK